MSSHWYYDASVASCAVLLFAILSFRPLHPRNSRLACAVVLCTWFWTTTVWAKSTKQLVREYGVHGVPPSVTLWLTMIPQVLSVFLLMGLMSIKGELSALVRNLSTHGPDGAAQTAAWFTGGACYFYGQLLTVVAIAGASPMIVFVVKAVEPLSTALLAIPILGQKPSLALFAGLVLACAGIITTYLGGGHGQSHGGPQSPGSGVAADLARSYSGAASLTILAALLANLGFSGRACMVKQAYGRPGCSPLASLATLSLTGAISGFVPVLIWPVALVLHHWWHGAEAAVWDRPLILDDASPGVLRLWASASVSYCIYQCSSLLILDCVAVESHALLVAVKHVFTAILAALMVGEQLSATSLLGGAITAAGICIYATAPGNAEGLPGGEKLAKPPSDEKSPLEPAARPQQPSAILASIAVILVGAGTGAVFLQAGK